MDRLVVCKLAVIFALLLVGAACSTDSDSNGGSSDAGDAAADTQADQTVDLAAEVTPDTGATCGPEDLCNRTINGYGEGACFEMELADCLGWYDDPPYACPSGPLGDPAADLANYVVCNCGCEADNDNCLDYFACGDECYSANCDIP